MIILLPLLIALIGLLMYFLCVNNPKLAEIGRIMFFAGLLVFLLGYHGQTITVMR